MEVEVLHAAIVRNSAVLAEAARRTGPDLPVPTCPGWNVAKLVKHTGTTHRWATEIVERQATEPIDPRARDLGLPVETTGLPDWLEDGAGELVERLEQVDPDTPTWAWGPDRHARFWSRRMAHETAVHRFDGERAVGAPSPIDGVLAVDGVDEFLENLEAALRFGSAEVTGHGETIHLHATDRDGEWLLLIGPDGVDVSREHVKADVAVRAGASDLLLMLMGRVAPADVETFGDVAILERWQRDVRI